MDVKDVLTEARRIITQGWNQGALTDGRGNYCLQAAIGLAAGVYTDIDGRVGYRTIEVGDATTEEMRHYTRLLRDDLAASAVVKQHLPQQFAALSLFNDHHDTTKNDVVAVLDKAIASC